MIQGSSRFLTPWAAGLALASSSAAADPGARPAPGVAAAPLEVEHWIQATDLGPRGEFKPVTALDGGSIYLIDFWGTWCVPCVAEMDELSALQERFATDGVRVIGITEESLPQVVRFMQRIAADGQTHFARARYTVGADPDGSTMRALIPEAYRPVRPFAVLVGREGVIEWMGVPTADSEPALEEVIEQVIAGTWDRERFAVAWTEALARKKEQDRIQREEDWTSARAVFWDDAQFLAQVAFRIAFNYGGQVQDADPEVARALAERAVELTGQADAYALHTLARVRFNAGDAAEAVRLQRRAIEVDPEGGGKYYTDALRQYEAAAGGG